MYRKTAKSVHLSIDSNMRRKQVFTLYWLLLAAGVAITAVILWQHGLFQQLFESDTSKLSSIILLVFLLASCHAGFYLFRFSADLKAIEEQRRLLMMPTCEHSNVSAADEGIPPRLRGQLSVITTRHDGSEPSNKVGTSTLVGMLDNQIKAPVQLGWLLSDLLIKLGLLGTVIGFILMLGAISDGGSIDISNIDTLLTDMGSGMRVALFTTLTGLITGTLLGFQYYIVERAADVLMASIAEYIELHIASHHSAAI